jgi:hypothetical protein
LCIHVIVIFSQINFHFLLARRTPHVEAEDRSLPPCLALSRFLCKQAKHYIFGDGNVNSATKQNASRVATKRKIPSITVYILSNNNNATTTHVTDIAFLFEMIPVRLFTLSKTDFFTSDELGVMTTPLFSIGQYAAMYASKVDYNGSPVLLLNGGTAVTYMAMDNESKLLGGGACPGIAIRCRTLFDYCSEDFPSIGFEKYKKITDTAKAEKKPISLFASNLEEGVIANATSEMAGQLRNIVKQFVKTVGGPSTTLPPKVVITGGDGDTEIIVQLLQENCSNLIVPEPDVAFPPSCNDMICVRKNMAAFGIQHILVANQKKKAPQNPDDTLRENIIGLRAAMVSKKSSSTPQKTAANDNKKKIQRGSIVRVMPGNKFEDDTFIVLTDEGEEIFLDLVQLYDAMFLYTEVGEELKEKDKEDWVGEKRIASTKVQEDLVEKNNKIQKRKEELDAIKKKEGSVVNMLTSLENEKRGEKRPRPTPTATKDDPKKYIGQRVAKIFEMPSSENVNKTETLLYFGTVDKITDPSNLLWHVQYDDGDEEDYDFREIRAGILLNAKHKASSTKD